MSPMDDEMRALFDDLRAEDTARAPRFSTLLSEAADRTIAPERPPRVSRRWPKRSG